MPAANPVSILLGGRKTMTKSTYDLKDIHVRMNIITHITELFNKNIELENIVTSKLDEYDPLIDAYKELLARMAVVAMSLSKQPQSDFTEATIGMLNAMINAAQANMQHWEKLKGKAFRTAKYGFFENNHDMKHIAELVKQRQAWGLRMNELNRSIIRENEA